jgi:hypothetical protein
MALPPAMIFEVCFTVPQEMRWCMRAKGAFDDWILSSAERAVAELPAADLVMHTDHCELSLTWIELPANNAWHALQKAAVVIEEVLPELLRVRSLRTAAKMQNPDPDVRRPVGS